MVGHRRGRPDAAGRTRGDRVRLRDRVVHGSVPGVGGGRALVVRVRGGRRGVRGVGRGGALLDEARAGGGGAEVVLRGQRVVGRGGEGERLLGALLQAADHVTGEIGR